MLRTHLAIAAIFLSIGLFWADWSHVEMDPSTALAYSP